MNKIIVSLRNEAKALVAGQDLCGFYRKCQSELQFCRDTFFDHPLLIRLQEDVLPFLYDDYGHGIDHSKKVAIEAGAIALAEGSAWDVSLTRRLALLAMLTGLLHDICRLEENHAAKGAEMAMTILHEYPLSDSDKDMIAFAIANHEAFRPAGTPPDEGTALVAAAVYDADKFRWGPDNFVTTLWEICDYEEWPLSEILKRFPQGLERVASIASTFRTDIGRTHGPELIDMGMEIGRTLHAKLRDYCAREPCDRVDG